jgi:hypothetical protein
MKILFAASLLFLFALPEPTIPSVLLGTWKVGRAYNTPGATDLNQQQLLQIEKMRFAITSDALNTCGKTIPIKSVTLTVRTPDEFAIRYAMGPNRIGLNGGKITELEINSFELTHACGDFSDPGTDILFDEQDHFAIEVDNSYYQLNRAKLETK